MIEFADGSKITYYLPPLRISGLLFGSRIIEWHGSIEFKYEKHDLMAKIDFYEGAGFFSRNEHPSDHFE